MLVTSYKICRTRDIEGGARAGIRIGQIVPSLPRLLLNEDCSTCFFATTGTFFVRSQSDCLLLLIGRSGEVKVEVEASDPLIPLKLRTTSLKTWNCAFCSVIPEVHSIPSAAPRYLEGFRMPMAPPPPPPKQLHVLKQQTTNNGDKQSATAYMHPSICSV